ncbi:MAG: MBL fold metallo-hydrolase [Candidatus Binataceae bacterium]
MQFRELNNLKCKTYLGICERARRAIIIDPLRERIERYLGVLAYQNWRLDLIVDTHTHADHRSGAAELSELTGAPGVMHRRAPAPYVQRHVDNGDVLRIGECSLSVLYTPGHMPDSISLVAEDRVFTGDVLLIHGTGRADFAGGDPGEQYDAITRRLFTLPEATLVFPAHDYRGHTQSTIGEEKRSNPRIAGRTRDEYIQVMNNLGLALPDKIQEALQPNQSAIDDSTLRFPTYSQLNAVRQLSPQEVAGRLTTPMPPILVDVREEAEYRGDLGHIAGSMLIPLRELPERAPSELADLKERDIIAICRVGVRSSTAAAILTGLGFERVWNMKGGMLDWNEAQLPVER